MDVNLQLIGVTCQIIVVFIFIGSFTIGVLNLKAFNVSNRAMTLKNVTYQHQLAVGPFVTYVSPYITEHPFHLLLSLPQRFARLIALRNVFLPHSTIVSASNGIAHRPLNVAEV